MMHWRKRCEVMRIEVSDTQAQAMDELENRGLYFCAHFGTENACDILESMDHAFAMGRLYEWMREQLGIVTQ